MPPPSTVAVVAVLLVSCLLMPAMAGYGAGSEPGTGTQSGTGDSVVFPAPSSSSSSSSSQVTSETLVVRRPDAVGPFPRATSAVNGVASRLHALVDPSGRKNYIVSPVSVAVIVGQLLLAARGETQTRLRALLSPSRTPRRPDDGAAGDAELHRQLGALQQSLQASASASASALQLLAGNAFFYQTDVRMSKAFMEDLAGYYRSELTAIDFKASPRSAQKAINAWVSGKTGGVFDAVLPAPLPPSTAAVLVNTLYFKASWLTPFDTDLTVTAPFHLNGTHLIDVAYMRGQFDILYADSDDLRCRLIVLPYKHKDVNMYVVLPHRRLEMDIKDFAESLTPSALAALVNATEENSVTVVLPRMTLKTRFSLKDPIASYRPLDGVSSRLADEDAVEEATPWMTGRQNVTSRTKPTTTSRTPTSKPRRPSTTPTTSQQPPRTTKRGQEAADEEGTASSKPPKKPSGTGYRPTPPKATSSRPAPRPTTSTQRTPSTTRRPADEFRFDLSGASTDPRFSVEDVVHQISLEVTELGTEAAAVSVVDVNYSGDIRVVKLDRPFVLFVRHEPSLSNLFWAVITDPTNGDYA